jgi:transposase
MLSVEHYEAIRRAYYVEKKSVRQIARELRCSRKTVDKALTSATPAPYTRSAPYASPKLGPFKARLAELLAEREQQPPKQRYTAAKLYTILHAEGYQGSQARLRGYLSELHWRQPRPRAFFPLEFDPGQDAQVDWGEACAIIAGERCTVQLFVLRLCYSRRTFAMAFPTQRQEAFFQGHVQAFHFLHGVPHRLAYDNLTTAVRKVLEGHSRLEQTAFITFRSHYLFASHFCTVGEGHEKGQIEHGVGYVRRNFLTPIPIVDSFAALNALLREHCEQDATRQVQGQPASIGAMWQQEQPLLRPLPSHDLLCCTTTQVTRTPYSQVIFETNRYSVPVNQGGGQLTLRAYPFQVEILDREHLLATHPRCYGREQDLFDPLHYLPLLLERPGAFEHAKPIRRWRETWPPSYAVLLTRLRHHHGDGSGLRAFLQILKLHQTYPAALIEAAIEQALQIGCLHADGVRLCLHHLLHPEQPHPRLELTEQPHLAAIGAQPITLDAYETLLSGGTA